MHRMRRFVILRHTLPANADRPSHWDLMFDVGDTGLKTWAVYGAPDSGEEQPADQLADHRMIYLDFEGALASNRGHVARWDAGTHEVVAQDATRMQFHLSGFRVQGNATFALAHDRWMYRFEPD